VSAAQTLSTRRRPTWIAPDARGIAHAQHAGAPRTACGQPATAERFAWPTASRCPDCVVALGLAGEAR